MSLSLKVSSIIYNDEKPPFSAEFGRINIVLGANGSGKSKLLHHMAVKFVNEGLKRKPVLVEGGRRTDFELNIGLSAESMGIYDKADVAEENYLGNRTSTLNNRLRQTFVLLKALEQKVWKEHSNHVENLIRSGNADKIKSRGRMPFEAFCSMFEAIFPELKVDITPNNQIYIKKGKAHYPATGLSDGEKQIFVLIADLLILKRSNQVLLIDEPELNLNYKLADDFWRLVESELDEDTVFIYATHDLSFALRDDVDTINLLEFGPISPFEIHAEQNHLRPFIGAFPKLTTKKNILLVEGTEDSIDTPLYKWLLQREDIRIIPLGAASEVSTAASRAGLWSRLSTDIKLTGIIDADFKSDFSDLHNCTVLPYHEAESILAHPRIVFELQKKLKNLESPKSYDEIVDIMVAEASTRIDFVVLQRAFRRLSMHLNVSISRELMAKQHDFEQTLVLIEAASEAEKEKAEQILGRDAVNKVLNEERSRCKAAVDSKNVDEILVLFEGKNLLRRMFPLSGCRDPRSMMKAVSNHLEVSILPSLPNIAESINTRINQQPLAQLAQS